MLNRRNFTKLLCAAPLAGLLPAKDAPVDSLVRVYEMLYWGSQSNTLQSDSSSDVPGVLYHCVSIILSAPCGAVVLVHDILGVRLAAQFVRCCEQAVTVFIPVPHRRSYRVTVEPAEGFWLPHQGPA